MRRASPSAALLVFSLLMAWTAYGLGLGGITQPAPGFFPFWISSCLALTSMALLVQSLREEESARSLPWFEFSVFWPVLAVIAAPATFGILLEHIGFLPATFLMLAVFWFGIDGQPPVRGLLITATSAVCAYLLFDKLLGVHFPRGLLGF